MKKTNETVQSETVKHEKNLFIDSQKQGNDFNEKLSEKLETTDRFLIDAVRGSAFTFEGSIAEFVDNAIDAQAKTIIIHPQENRNGLYDITIFDDGKGIPADKIYNVFKKLGYGQSTDYSSSAISNFGLGAKFAIINLCTKGTSIIESVHNNKRSKVLLNVDGVPQVFSPQVEELKTPEPSYTKIFIPNVVCSGNQISTLKKFLGCTYYPHIENGNKLNLKVWHKNEYSQIDFFDPLYRKVSQGTQKNFSDCEINGYKVYLRGMTYDYSFPSSELSPWDIKQGSSSFAGARSGLYFRLGGRYITLGKGIFASKSAQSQQWRRARIRIEVELDRELIPVFGVGFNKSILNLDEDNPSLKPFFNELDPIVAWANKIVMAFRKDGDDPELTDEQRQQNEEIEKRLSQRRRKHPLDMETLEIPENTEPKPEIPEKEEPKGTKIRPSGLTYNKDGVEIWLQRQGPDVPCFTYSRINKKLIITFNTDHNFYLYYESLPSVAQEVCSTIIMSLCDTIFLTKLDMTSDNITWEEDILRNLSTRLNKYLSI